MESSRKRKKTSEDEIETKGKETDRRDSDRGVFRLQVECFGLFRFITVVDPDITIENLKRDLEKEILDLYGWDLEVRWLKDPLQNDLVPRYLVKQVLRDFDQVYIYVERIDSPPAANAERERGTSERESSIPHHMQHPQQSQPSQSQQQHHPHHHHLPHLSDSLGESSHHQHNSDMSGGNRMLFSHNPNTTTSSPAMPKPMWSRDMDTNATL